MRRRVSTPAWSPRSRSARRCLTRPASSSVCASSSWPWLRSPVATTRPATTRPVMTRRPPRRRSVRQARRARRDGCHRSGAARLGRPRGERPRGEAAARPHERARAPADHPRRADQATRSRAQPWLARATVSGSGSRLRRIPDRRMRSPSRRRWWPRCSGVCDSGRRANLAVASSVRATPDLCGRGPVCDGCPRRRSFRPLTARDPPRCSRYRT